MAEMRAANLKQHLLQIAEGVTSQTTLEQVYERLALLADVEQAEQEVSAGEVLTQQEVEKQAREWLN